MDKPQSLSMREYLVRKIAPKLLISEKVVDAVIAHEFSEANSAMLSNNTVEISGFGKFIFNTKKAQKRMEKLESKKALFSSILDDQSLSETKRQSALNKLNNTINSIEQLKQKMYGQFDFTDLRGVEEQANSSSSDEGDNRGDKC